MSGPRIKVTVALLAAPDARRQFKWECPECANRVEQAASYDGLIFIPHEEGYEFTVAEAIDAGISHLHTHHPQTEWAAGGNVYQPPADSSSPPAHGAGHP